MARMTSRQLWTAKLNGGPVPRGAAKRAASAKILLPKRHFEGLVLGIDPSLRGTGLALLDFQ